MLLENDSVCKLLKKGMETIAHFVQIEKNQHVVKFFTENGYKIFLQVCLPLLSFDKMDPSDDAMEYVQELNDVCDEQTADSYRT